jgi:hypothetical protein
LRCLRMAEGNRTLQLLILSESSFRGLRIGDAFEVFGGEVDPVVV